MAHAQSMSVTMSSSSSEVPKPKENVGVFVARSQTYLALTAADKAVGQTVTFLPHTTYTFDFSEGEASKREKSRKYTQSERLLLPTAGFFVEYLRRDKDGSSAKGSTLGAGMSFRTVQALKDGKGRHSALVPYAGVAFGFWRTTSEGQSATRLGSRLFAGLELRSGLVLEASYSDRPTVRSFAPRGANVSLGVRF
jgi:hypothetical protein